MKIYWSTERDRYEAESEYKDKDTVKAAGFWWDPKERMWWTAKDEYAQRLIEFAEPECKERIEGAAKERGQALEASHAKESDINVPAPDGLELMPFQKAGVAFCMNRENVLIGDSPGLGKTIQAIGIVNLDETIKRVLIICPASLKLNWEYEAERWLTRSLTVGIASSKVWPDTDIIIINYDVLVQNHDNIRAYEWDLLIADEIHFCKNPKAKRTAQVLGKWARKIEDRIFPIVAKRRVFMTGTPIANRPIEIWPVAHSLAPKEFKSWRYFVTRYCNAQQTRWGWDTSGSSNLGELQEKLRQTIMVRRLKEEVLTELPPKVRQVIEFPANGMSGIITAEREAWDRNEEALEALRVAVELSKASDDEEEYREAVKNLRDGMTAAFNEMSKVRHETAVAKIPYMIEHIENCEGSKVVIFAHHRDVVESLKEHFGDQAVVLYGGMKAEAKDEAVTRFQNDASVQIFIGSIAAAGVGLTLTASSHVVFGEISWVPGDVSQAEDRLHRIGQQNSVLVQHLVLEGSLDARMAKVIVSKQRVIDAALDNEVEHEDWKMPTIPSDTAERPRREQIEEEALHITDEQREAIHSGLRHLSAMCDGAQALDGAGFNKIDTDIGKSLAGCPGLSMKQAALGKRLVKKYRRQLPEEILEAVG